MFIKKKKTHISVHNVIQVNQGKVNIMVSKSGGPTKRVNIPDRKWPWGESCPFSRGGSTDRAQNSTISVSNARLYQFSIQSMPNPLQILIQSVSNPYQIRIKSVSSLFRSLSNPFLFPNQFQILIVPVSNAYQIRIKSVSIPFKSVSNSFLIRIQSLSESVPNTYQNRIKSKSVSAPYQMFVSYQISFQIQTKPH